MCAAGIRGHGQRLEPRVERDSLADRDPVEALWRRGLQYRQLQPSGGPCGLQPHHTHGRPTTKAVTGHVGLVKVDAVADAGEPG